jgi:SAM-dependent methyltransferase
MAPTPASMAPIPMHDPDPADPRIQAPAAARNRDAILAALTAILPARGLLLEIASGSGEHVSHFAQALPEWRFQPSDPDPTRRASIDAWATGAALPNVRPALDLDAATAAWGLRADAVLCINMIHIAPWRAAQGLVAGAAQVLAEGGLLCLYGPYRRGGAHTAPSNAAFDADLRRRDPDWGVRDLEAVAELAARAGFAPPEIIAMPANNLLLAFSRLGPGG